MNNSKSLILSLLTTLCLVCLTRAQLNDATTTMQPSVCPPGLEKGTLDQVEDWFKKNVLNQQVTQCLEPSTTTTTTQAPPGLRRKRDLSTKDLPDNADTAKEVIENDIESLEDDAKKQSKELEPSHKQEGRLRHLLNNIKNSHLMPSREQQAQLLGYLFTMVLLLLLGPLGGANSQLIMAGVKQMVPIMVSWIMGLSQAPKSTVLGIEAASSVPASITSIELKPVTPHSPSSSSDSNLSSSPSTSSRLI